MNHPAVSTRRLPFGIPVRIALLCVLVLAMLLNMVWVPGTAVALSNCKLTAQSNSDEDNAVLGGKTTRLAYVAYPDDGEVVSAMSFTLPDGTTYNAETSTAEMRKTINASRGENMDQVDLGAHFTAAGQTVTVAFDNPTPAEGGYIRVMIKEVVFPNEGGSMKVTGTYTTTAGDTFDLPDMEAIEVEGVSWARAASMALEEMDWVKAWNSVSFLNLFFNPVLIVRSIPSIFNGFLAALAVVALAFPLAIPVGLLLALMRISKRKILRGIATCYVNIIRGTPLFLQIYIMFFGLPLAGIQVPMYAMAVVVLSLNSGAYLCEIIRAGIQSIPKGQFEASRSLGMTGTQTMVYVILPQTVRRIIPTMTSEFILLYKDTSLLASVGFMEIILYAKNIVAATGSVTPYVVAAMFYLVLTLPMTKLVGTLEAKLASSESGKDAKAQKKNDAGSRDGDDAIAPEGVSDGGNGGKIITPEQYESM